MKKIASSALAVLLCVLLCGCAGIQSKTSFYAMGSMVTLTSYGGNAQSEIESAVVGLENVISCRIGDSAAAKLNDSGSAENETLAEIMRFSKTLSERTGGKYDTAIYGITSLWDFDAENPVPPSESEALAAAKGCGYGNVNVEGDRVTLLNGVKIDLGSLGKGLACDKAAEIMKEKGISGVAAVGGSIGVCGKKPDGSDFVIGIRNPFASGSEYFATLSLHDCFVSTSGSYEKTFEYENVIYHHILDTSTGYPVDTDIVSVTVVCESGMASDALSTAVFCVGYENGLSLLKQYGAEAVIVFSDNHVVVTKGLEERFKSVSDGFEVSYAS